MRKLLTRSLCALALLCALSTSALAIDVTVASVSVDGYQYGGTTATLRIYASQTFTASDGSIVVGAAQVGSGVGFYKSVTCTVASTTLTCPSLTLKSTTDALEGADATYTAVLFDSKGTRRDFFPVSDFWLTHTAGATTTWAVIRQTINSSPRPPSNTGYPTNEQMLAAIAANNTVGNPATTTALGRVKMSVAPADAASPVAVGDNDPRNTNARAPSGAAGGDLTGTYPNPTLSSAVIKDRGGQVFSVKAYGAVGDGVTDDTAAVRAAYTAAAAARGRLFFPAGRYLVDWNSGPLLTVAKSIEIYGAGSRASQIVVKSTVSTSLDVIKVVPPVVTNVVDTWLTSSGLDNEGYYWHDFGIVAQSEPSVRTNPYPSQPARHAIYFDITAANQWLFNSHFERLYLGSFSGRGMYFNNSNGAGSYRNGDGFAQITIKGCTIRNGILGVYWGDHIVIEDNDLVGQNVGIESTQVPGAANITVRHNRNTTQGGAALFHNGRHINYLDNEDELYVLTSAGVNGATLSFLGDVGTIENVNYTGNLCNANIPGIGTPLDCAYLDRVTVFAEDNNRYIGMAGKYAVKTTLNTNVPIFGANSVYISNSDVAFNFTNGLATSPVYVPKTTASEPTANIPGYLGVDKVYTRVFKLTGTSAPLTPSSGSGPELWYDTDGRVLSGAYSATGGSGISSFLSYDRDTSALRDMQIGAAKLLLNATGGVSVSAGTVVSLDSGTATATAGAATLNKQTGIIISDALTTAAGSSYTLTLTNSLITSSSRVFPVLSNGTNTQGQLTLGLVTPGSGSATIEVRNTHASQALNGTVKVSFVVF